MKGFVNGRVVSVSAAFVLLALPFSPARAGEREPHYRPSGFGDLYTGGMAAFDMNFAIGDDVTAYVPSFHLQYGVGDVAVGLQWGLAYADVDVPEGYEYDSEVAPGSFVLNFKAKHCIPGAWSTCMGTNFSLGIDPFELDSLEEALSLASGIYAHILRYVRYAPESIVIDPIFALNTTNQMIYVQIALGPSMLVPVDDTDKRDVEACLVYSFEFGVLVADMVSMGLGFRGGSTLTADDNESLFSLDVNLRLALGSVSPGFRLSIPFSSDDSLDEAFDLIVALGVAADF